MRAIRLTFLCLAVLIAASAAPGRASAEPGKCRRTIAKELGKYSSAVTALIQKCKDGVITKGDPPSLGDCQPASLPKVAMAAQKLRAKIASACGGADGTCATTADNDPLGSIGWDGGFCMDFESRGCANLISNCDDITDCLVCIADTAVDQGLDALVYDPFLATPFTTRNAANRCQVAVGKAGAKFLEAKTKILGACWDAKLAGRAGFADADRCPDTDPRPGSGKPPAQPGDNRTVEQIKGAEQKKIAAICNACGAGGDADRDGQCDAPPGLALASFLSPGFTCPDVTVPSNAVHPGGLHCGAITVHDLPSYVACVDCVLEFKADCVTDAAVGDHDSAQGIAYPAECNAPAPGNDCPTRYSFAANGAAADIDIGWSGIAHDEPLPTNARLTAQIVGCASSVAPCGECTLVGPIANGADPALDNRRCRGDAAHDNGTWIRCESDSDCPGAGNACTYFFGPPQPTAVGGALLCVTNEISAPFSGTLDVDTGSTAFPLSITSTEHFIGFASSPVPVHPCPRCVAGSCTDGARAGQPCTVNGTSNLFGDDVSFDCPPDPASAVAGPLRVRIPVTTGTQTVVTTAASPSCTGLGHTALHCLCDTCDDAAATPCMSNADCAPGGVCGGLRCLGGPTPGTPCTVQGMSDPTCCSEPTCSSGDVGACDRPGQATQPNDCTMDGICSPTPADLASVDEGRCSMGPSDTHCEIETFRPCLANSDCPAAGDACTAERRNCFTTNGAIGDDVAAGGVASRTTPTLAGLFCVGPSASAQFNLIYGLPGLGRVTLPGTAAIQ